MDGAIFWMLKWLNGCVGVHPSLWYKNYHSNFISHSIKMSRGLLVVAFTKKKNAAARKFTKSCKKYGYNV